MQKLYLDNPHYERFCEKCTCKLRNVGLLQRKCLQPNHFVTTTALETALSEYIAYYNQTAKPINWTYTVEKLEQKLGTHL